MDRLTNMMTFVEVVEAGSFTAASDKKGLSRAVVSKYVMQLEEHLNARLLNRTTRQLSLTEIGRLYYEQCKSILAEIEEVEACASEASANPRGQLSVNAPMSFGVLHLGPAIAAYCKRYPLVQISLDLNDRLVDVVAEGYDVVIRIAQLRDSSFIAREIAPCRRVLCASPDYLKTYGVPKVPQDLTLHRCLCYTNHPNENIWTMNGPQGTENVRVNGPVSANNGEILKSAAVEGLGIALEPTFIVGPEIKAGRLRLILPDHQVPDININAIYPSRRHLSTKVRTFVEFLGDYFGDDPAWDEFESK
jgi:DNA-binding transcriptional LysR family regulator